MNNNLLEQLGISIFRDNNKIVCKNNKTSEILQCKSFGDDSLLFFESDDYSLKIITSRNLKVLTVIKNGLTIRNTELSSSDVQMTLNSNTTSEILIDYNKKSSLNHLYFCTCGKDFSIVKTNNTMTFYHFNYGIEDISSIDNHEIVKKILKEIKKAGASIDIFDLALVQSILYAKVKKFAFDEIEQKPKNI